MNTNRYSKLILILPLLLFYLCSFSQKNFEIAGVIKNYNDKKPIEGAHILCPRIHSGSVSDSSGNFLLKLDNKIDNFVIEISHLCYQTKRIEIDTLRVPEILTIELDTQAVYLNEVVVQKFKKENISRIIKKALKNTLNRYVAGNSALKIYGKHSSILNNDTIGIFEDLAIYYPFGLKAEKSGQAIRLAKRNVIYSMQYEPDKRVLGMVYYHDLATIAAYRVINFLFQDNWQPSFASGIDFLDKNSGYLYQKMDDIKILGNNIIVIGFQSIDTQSLWCGAIYIDTSINSIIRVEANLNHDINTERQEYFYCDLIKYNNKLYPGKGMWKCSYPAGMNEKDFYSYERTWQVLDIIEESSFIENMNNLDLYSLKYRFSNIFEFKRQLTSLSYLKRMSNKIEYYF